MDATMLFDSSISKKTDVGPTSPVAEVEQDPTWPTIEDELQSQAIELNMTTKNHQSEYTNVAENSSHGCPIDLQSLNNAVCTSKDCTGRDHTACVLEWANRIDTDYDELPPLDELLKQSQVGSRITTSRTTSQELHAANADATDQSVSVQNLGKSRTQSSEHLAGTRSDTTSLTGL